MFASTKVLLLTQLLILLFLASTSMALVKVVKRQSENGAGAGPAEETHVGFEGNDPPPSSLNEPISAIGPDQQAEDGKGLADIAYDTVEEQSQSSAASSSWATSPSSTSAAATVGTVSLGIGDTESAAETRLQDTAASEGTPSAATEEASSIAGVEEENNNNSNNENNENNNNSPSSNDSGDAGATASTVAEEEQRLEETVATATTASSTARRIAAAASTGKKQDERKGRKKTGLPTAAVETAATDGTVTTPATAQQQQQRNCNSERIRQLIIENIHSKPSVAKRQIQSKVAEEINGKIDVICARHAFSYIVNSELFCEAEHNGVICLCFKQQ
ncbi:hypothetical protein niasHT_005725 [Heterodera trifolii]|uniref:Ground-like domain-containing protein n=1 Tax=Heterodera trifolii TaxID=157864 RepID=A0ABD2LYV4_9BILA